MLSGTTRNVNKIFRTPHTKSTCIPARHSTFQDNPPTVKLILFGGRLTHGIVEISVPKRTPDNGILLCK